MSHSRSRPKGTRSPRVAVHLGRVVEAEGERLAAEGHVVERHLDRVVGPQALALQLERRGRGRHGVVDHGHERPALAHQAGPVPGGALVGVEADAHVAPSAPSVVAKSKYHDSFHHGSGPMGGGARRRRSAQSAGRSWEHGTTPSGDSLPGVRYLSPEWLDAAGAALAADDALAAALAGVTLTVEQAVDGTPDGTVRWHVAIEDGKALTPAGGPPRRFTTTYPVAAAVARGDGLSGRSSRAGCASAATCRC